MRSAPLCLGREQDKKQLNMQLKPHKISNY